MINIIAECGLNYNTFDGAINYCNTAKDIGADIIKFQVTDIENTWKTNPNEMYYKIQDIQLCEAEWETIKIYCDSIGIEFLATPSSIRKLDFLMSIGMTKIKIASDRAEDAELVNHALKYNVPVIISNGYTEIKYDNENIEKMYCVSKYPAKLEDYDLSAIDKTFTGFSDHTLEYGEKIVNILKDKNMKYYEKHFKLDNDCIDYHSSLYPDQFEKLIKRIHNG